MTVGAAIETGGFSLHPCYAPAMSIEDFVTRADGADSDSFEWGEITWLDGGELTAGTGLTFGRVTFYSDGTNAEHRHPNCEEVLYLLSGRLAHTIGEDRTTLEPGDALHIPRNEPHQATNLADDDAVAIIAYDTADRRVEFVE